MWWSPLLVTVWEAFSSEWINKLYVQSVSFFCLKDEKSQQILPRPSECERISSRKAYFCFFWFDIILILMIKCDLGSCCKLLVLSYFRLFIAHEKPDKYLSKQGFRANTEPADELVIVICYCNMLLTDVILEFSYYLSLK